MSDFLSNVDCGKAGSRTCLAVLLLAIIGYGFGAREAFASLSQLEQAGVGLVLFLVVVGILFGLIRLSVLPKVWEAIRPEYEDSETSLASLGAVVISGAASYFICLNLGLETAERLLDFFATIGTAIIALVILAIAIVIGLSLTQQGGRGRR